MSERPELQPGDVVFTRINNLLYRQVAQATQSWTSHVGVVVRHPQQGLVVAESRVPKSTLTPFDAFVARSERGMYAVRRLPRALSEQEQAALFVAAERRLGMWYDFGFNYDSPRQYCSKFVYDVMAESTGELIGDLETFQEQLDRFPRCPRGFWRLWFFGRIPWGRRAVTPASQFRSKRLQDVVLHGIPAAL